MRRFMPMLMLPACLSPILSARAWQYMRGNRRIPYRDAGLFQLLFALIFDRFKSEASLLSLQVQTLESENRVLLGHLCLLSTALKTMTADSGVNLVA
jgi:hypothetical protein